MTQALSTEKRPILPISKDYRPMGAYQYKVVDNDTWINVAARRSIDVQDLIRFNCQTNHPGEVNWYLREYTGCNVHTRDRQNWMFSTSASPGKIWMPTLTMPTNVVLGRRTVSPLAMEFQGAAGPLSGLGKLFDAFTLADMALGISAILPVAGAAEAAEAAMLGAGIVVTLSAPFVALGGPHEAALNVLRNREILEGLSTGVVLAADGRSAKYISDGGFVKKWPVTSVDYPQYGKQLQGVYNTSLVAGIAHGRQFNTVASKNLFAWARSQMNDFATAEYAGDPKSWDSRKWYNWYKLCAAILQRKIVLR